ncbi:aspartate kinase [Candidatus Aerophobetes bacterium]|uniref:aspartate kinase n=1 Tax=Aerophobetes bacterium TaxID=2030807 RepID=A0A2A4YFV3_UNCAE|nr:MAG: aspartate kinase [Candidatus Aerophobetes bacterium]
METLVLKFGGAAFSKTSDFGNIADIIIEHKKTTRKIVIVVSAMKNMTSNLIELSKSVHPSPPKREQDMLVSVGERISMSLLAMALHVKGVNAVSFTGSQSGIITNADHANAFIQDVKPYRIQKELTKGNVVIVAGFQGMSVDKEITTLGRGGSDTTAVALGVALNAREVIFYKDVSGVYTKDPKKYANPMPISYLHYIDALAIVKNGAQILHKRAIVLAEKNHIPLLVTSFKTRGKDFFGTRIESLVVREVQSKYYELQSVNVACQASH